MNAGLLARERRPNAIISHGYVRDLAAHGDQSLSQAERERHAEQALAEQAGDASTAAMAQTVIMRGNAFYDNSARALNAGELQASRLESGANQNYMRALNAVLHEGQDSEDVIVAFDLNERDADRLRHAEARALGPLTYGL